MKKTIIKIVITSVVGAIVGKFLSKEKEAKRREEGIKAVLNEQNKTQEEVQ